MATLNIEGRKVTVDDSFLKLSPEEQAATVDEIAGQLGITPGAGQQQAEQPESDTVKSGRESLAKTFNEFANPTSAGRTVDSFARGFADTVTSGGADELAGLAQAASKATNPFAQDSYLDMAKAAVRAVNPIQGIAQAIGEGITKGPNNDAARQIKQERIIQTQRDDMDPIASTTGRISGALAQMALLRKANAPMTGDIPANASLGQKVMQSGKSAGLYSAAYGIGSGEGVKGRIEEGVTSGLTGLGLGMAVPVVAAGVKSVAKPVTDAIKGYANPEAFANQKIAERVANAGMTVEQAAMKMDRGNNTALADIGGKNTRSLLRSTVNVPGKAQDAVPARLNMRQFSQGDRIKTIIRKTFADPENFEAAKQDLFKIQSVKSGPLYEKALSKKGVWNDRLQQFIDDPIMRRGLAQGVKIQRLESLAENKPFNPLDFAITGFNEAGDPIISGVPNMRTINVMKKGIDAMFNDDALRNQVTGKLTEQGRAVDAVRRAFLAEVDKVNPDYAIARKSYADFMQVNDAMEFGKKLFTMSPASVRERVAQMTPFERIAARAGAAEAMRKAVDEVGWTNDAVLKLFNSRQKAQNLRALFNSKEEFAAARKMVFDEIRKRGTYNTVRGNSTTVAQAADLADAGGLNDTIQLGVNTVKQGPVSATLQYVGSRLKMLGGFTPEVADRVGKKLLTTDPQAVRELVNQLAAIERQNISRAAKANLVQRTVSLILAEQPTAQRQQ